MALSFGETRAQARTIHNISLWLDPRSRHIDLSNPREITLEQLEKACGPIRNTQFGATKLNISMLRSFLDLAEGLLVEYAAVEKGYKLTEFHLPAGYSIVSTLPGCDPGKELALTMTVLQSIVNGNEAFSDHAEITERLEKLSETKDKLEKDGSEFPKIFSSLIDRIKNYDEVSEQEILEFIDQIEKDESYESHVDIFANHPYLLKGNKHVHFIQKVYAAMTTINMYSYVAWLSIMTSIVDNLSSDELEKALEASEAHFNAVAKKLHQYVPEFKPTGEKDGVVFTARVLVLGPIAACTQLAALLNSNDEKMAKSCEEILSQMSPPLHKMLLESEEPWLLRTLFGQNGPFFSSNFSKPMTHLVLPGIFPLHKLLNAMLKKSQAMRVHLSKVLSSEHTRTCILRVDENREETAQALISAFSIVACPESRVNPKLIRNLLNGMQSKCEGESDELTWMSKYDSYEKVATFIGLLKKPDESAEKPTSEDNGLIKEKEEVKEEGEKNEEDGEIKEKKKDGDGKKNVTNGEEKNKPEEKKKEGDGKKNVTNGEENKKPEEKKMMTPKERKKEQDRKKKEKRQKNKRDKKRNENGGVKKEENADNTKVPLGRSDEGGSSSMENGEIHPEEQDELAFRDEPFNGGEGEGEEHYDVKGDERLDATQELSISQEVGGFSNSLTNLDQIGNK